LQVKKGDCIGIISPNDLNYLPAFTGISLAGASSTCLNPLYSETEISYQLQNTNAKVVVCHPLCLERLTKAIQASSDPDKYRVIVMDTYQLDQSKIVALPKHSILMSHLTDDSIQFDPVSLQRHTSEAFDPVNTILTIPFSSGTTGASKGVMLSHRNIVANILQICQIEGEHVRETERHPRARQLIPLPFFHIFGLTAGKPPTAPATVHLIARKQGSSLISSKVLITSSCRHSTSRSVWR
jgi:acyl-CoA synthetase (AMP-forming)/AMP-acid ligase II